MDFDLNLVEKYFNGTATRDEAVRVLEWFETPKGSRYLEEHLEADLKTIEAFSKKSPDEHQTLKKIQMEIRGKEKFSGISKKVNKYPSKRRSVWLAAASFLLVISAVSLFQVFYGGPASGGDVENSPQFFSTSAEEHRLITMKDGTRIRLNEHSRLEVPASYNRDFRKVKLQGEAFFEVTEDPARPFIVDANQAKVQVLGTKFSVKHSSKNQKVIVAVSEGLVRMDALEGENGDQSHLLEKNMVGVYDSLSKEISAENMDVTNYMSWIHGRIVFERTPFIQVARQIGHMYDMDYRIEDEELLNLRLTADFTEKSPDNVLTTIAHTLGIQVNKGDDIIIWQKI